MLLIGTHGGSSLLRQRPDRAPTELNANGFAIGKFIVAAGEVSRDGIAANSKRKLFVTSDKIRSPGHQNGEYIPRAITGLRNSCSSTNTEIGRCLLRPANLDNGAFDRLSRYETALCRQIGHCSMSLKSFDGTVTRESPCIGKVLQRKPDLDDDDVVATRHLGATKASKAKTFLLIRSFKRTNACCASRIKPATNAFGSISMNRQS
jgi:hypothetical protein